MLSKLRRMMARTGGLLRKLDRLDKIHAMLVQESFTSLKSQPRHQDPRSLVPFGYKMYSQNEEDGIIREIFQRIGVTNKVFVEFGVGNGLENNTLALLFDGWSGLWIDADEAATQSIRDNYKKTIAAGALKITRSFITRDNINDLISAAIPAGEIDLLSVDIDGNDFHVFSAITCVKPRVVVIEYNAKFRLPVLFCMDYDAGHMWRHDDCLGASLKFLEGEFRKRNYCLVGCTLNGTNAFFVRADLAGDKFAEPFTAERHYEPARHYMAYSSGHQPSHRTLEMSMAARKGR